MIETILQCPFSSAIGNLPWFLVQKWVKILIVPSFWLKIDDLVVVFDCIVMNIYFTDSPWYYLTPCQHLLRLNVIFMVRKIDQLFKIFIIFIVSSFWLMLYGVTETSSLVILS